MVVVSFSRFPQTMFFGGTAVGKAPLTQYLGLPEELQRLEPSVTETSIRRDTDIFCAQME